MRNACRHSSYFSLVFNIWPNHRAGLKYCDAQNGNPAALQNQLWLGKQVVAIEESGSDRRASRDDEGSIARW
ncbi:hypothetical protein SAMD00023353_2600610 [Rosellinia necatrix]|uniref:Uncharacterized protein n=1 Tax=Rosellinia necatrix TaxID=77044 RepID=A0A1S8A840_ROSNE|nr:hypothetical protein SAMD00023353_2600610 [Rosellinia necatrix]